MSLQTETSIHHVMENAYKVTLACAFVPLVAGLYWNTRRFGTQGSIMLGFAVWNAMEFIAPEAAPAPPFAVLVASLAGIVAGSLLSTSHARA